MYVEISLNTHYPHSTHTTSITENMKNTQTEKKWKHQEKS